MVVRFRSSLPVSASTMLLAALAPAAALAQEASPTIASPTIPAAEADDDTIVVTGTRISRPEEEAAYPIASLDGEAIARSGETNLTSLLAETPALVNSVTSIRAAGTRALPGGAGINLLNLRNLGEERTLVLVNGRRHVSSLAGSAAVDINTIPLGLVERVDVLTGGVSAIYGADGVSGVVNFVMKRDFEGIEARGQTGISSRGDAGEYLASLTAGRNFAGGSGNIAASYEYRKSDRVASHARGFTSDGFQSIEPNFADFPDDPNVFDRIPYGNLRFATLSPAGAVDTNFDFFPDFLGTGSPYNPGLLIPNGNGLAQGGDGSPVTGNLGDLQPGVETHNANVLASYEVSPALRLFAEGKFVTTTAYTESQPLFDGGSILLADNAYLPNSIRSAIVPGALGAVLGAPPGAAPDGVLVFRDHYDFGIRGQRAKRETWRGVLGADGEIGDNARYEVAYTYGRTNTAFVDTNYRITDRYFAALDAVAGPGGVTCRSNLFPPAAMFDLNLGGRPVTTFTPGPESGCAPINILGTNVASQDALNFFMTDLRSEARLTQHVVSASLSGDFGSYFALPGGPVGFALGGEYRKESSAFTPDQLLQDGVILDRVMVSPESGSFDVWEAFAELQAPILRDVPGAHLLQIGAALRLSDYSTIGGTTAWKVDGTYAPVEDVRFRATYSESVRAPNIQELFAAQSGIVSPIFDPCDVAFVQNGSQFRADNCAALLNGFGIDPATFNPSGNPFVNPRVGGIASGNPDVREETAKTWTAGVVLEPRLVSGLSVSFDWYDIKLTDAISIPDAQDLVDLCVDQPSLDNPFCAGVVRNPASGLVAGFQVMPANVSRFRSAGADFSVNYVYEPAGNWGTVNLRLAGGYLDKLSFVATPGAAETVERREVYAPKWTGNLDIAWSLGNVTVNYGANYFSATRRFGPEEIAANPDISDPRYLDFREKWEHDLQLAVDAYDDRVTIYGGVNNLFDRKPDIGELNYPVSFRGRFIYFGVRADLEGL